MKIIDLQTDAVALFKERINKYLGVVDIISPFQQERVEVHIHDPGRLSEILFANNKLLLKYVDKPTRKTKWDVIAGLVDNNYILIHSNYHRKISENILKQGLLLPYEKIKKIKPEAKYQNSRLDFLITTQNNTSLWIEVKGCTLVKNSIAMFPDAPTKRGTKHLKSLLELTERGFKCALLILIFNPCAQYFTPNRDTDPEFTELFYKCCNVMDIYPFTFEYRDNSLWLVGKIPVV